MDKQNKDCLGNDIIIGDQVVYPVDTGEDRLRLKLGVIVGFTDNFVKIRPINSRETKLKIFEKVMKHASV